VKGRERSRDGAGEEGTEGPFSQILDTPLTVQRTPDRVCNTAYEMPSDAPITTCPIEAPGHKYM
jgi:hypothetical protein